MTAIDTAAGLPKPRFGVGSRLSDTFQIFSSRFALFGLIGVVAGFLMQLPSYLVVGAQTFDSASQQASQAFIGENPFLFVAVVVALPLLVYSVLTAVLVLAAYDAKAGRDANVGAYVATALRAMLPLIVLSIVAWILIGLGFAVFVVPGLWLLGVLAVYVPAIVVEGAGFGALGRSARLTKGYRWPIVGFVVLVYVLFYLAGIALGFVGGRVVGVSPVLFLLLQGIVSGLSAAFASIAVAVAYARLREIKDGVGFADLADVFA
ncbi:hypothetical protein [Jiella sonneratiae]|uniref:Glycerophosphoryl diester phosphodiesterase membrane domain-containing protein n=1 Tax=Jiella sonneratiae TaxID=2816856 RepID=A0ABS3J771_9HYPH|nr:hypothetical protein [Jiella sonneratiae]MBO0905506.1 hypothetical protein [Jiella sonneratiae]